MLDKENEIIPQATILYQYNSEEWKKKLKQVLEFYVKSIDSQKREFNYDIAIITATDVEWDILFNNLSTQWKPVLCHKDQARYFECTWSSNGNNYKVIATKLNQMGMPAAATLATKMIDIFCPKYLTMFGIAAGIDNEMKIGDIVVATTVWDYCSGKYDSPDCNENDAEEKQVTEAIRNFKPSSNSVNIDTYIKNMQNLKYDDDLKKIFSDYIANNGKIPPNTNLPKVWWGTMACGSSVIKNPAIVKELIIKHNRKTLAVDMESYGIYYAVDNAIKPKPVAICVKGISDFANRDKIDDYQEYSAYVSGMFLKTMLLNILDEAPYSD